MIREKIILMIRPVEAGVSNRAGPNPPEMAIALSPINSFGTVHVIRRMIIDITKFRMFVPGIITTGSLSALLISLLLFFFEIVNL